MLTSYVVLRGKLFPHRSAKDIEGVVAVGGGQTRVDIRGGRFAGLGIETGRWQVHWFGPQNRSRIRCGQKAMLEDT